VQRLRVHWDEDVGPLCRVATQATHGIDIASSMLRMLRNGQRSQAQAKRPAAHRRAACNTSSRAPRSEHRNTMLGLEPVAQQTLQYQSCFVAIAPARGALHSHHHVTPGDTLRDGQALAGAWEAAFCTSASAALNTSSFVSSNAPTPLPGARPGQRA